MSLVALLLSWSIACSAQTEIVWTKSPSRRYTLSLIRTDFVRPGTAAGALNKWWLTRFERSLIRPYWQLLESKGDHSTCVVWDCQIEQLSIPLAPFKLFDAVVADDGRVLIVYRYGDAVWADTCPPVANTTGRRQHLPLVHIRSLGPRVDAASIEQRGSKFYVVLKGPNTASLQDVEIGGR